MSKINIGDTFPNPLAIKKEKDEKKYGVRVYKAVLASTREYVEKRNRIIAENRSYAEGKQDMRPILDMMSLEGKKVFTNLSISPSKIVSKFKKIVVDGYMEKYKEFPKVTALSKHIKDRKAKKRSDAEFRMDNRKLIEQLTNEVGFPIEDPNAFTPEDKEELDIYFDLHDKEVEELLLQDVLTYVVNDIDIDSLKRRILSDLFDVNLFGLYEYLDNNGREVVDYIQAEDCLYGTSFYDDFRDINYAGRKMRISISQLRNRFNIPAEDEKFLWESAKKYSTKAMFPDWKEDFRFADVRPYDDYILDITHVWWKCSKVLEYTEGKDRYGRDVFDTSYKITNSQEKSDGRKRTGKVYPITAYEGYFVDGSCYCLEWGEQKRQLRDGNFKEELICPFIFRMIDNNGTMLTPSPVGQIKDYVQKMDLAELKIKQVIANTPPDGLAIDINTLANVNLTGGEEPDTPLDLVTIYRQTGDIYYNGKAENGETVQIPIRPTQSSFGDKIGTFISVYNLALSQIRDTLGINELRDGSANPTRVASKLAQTQIEASNTATISMYNGYVSSASKLLRQMGIRIWDALKWGTPNKGYLKYLGKDNVDIIKHAEDITQSIYDFKYEMGITADEVASINRDIEICLSSQSLEMPDAIRIRNTMNSGLKIAERQLVYLYEKRRKQKMEEAERNSKMAADANAQAGVAVEQAKQETAKMEQGVVLAKEKTRGEQERDKAMEMLAWDLIRKEQEGIPIPPKYQAVVDAVLTNRGLNVVQETTEKEQFMEQEAMAQEQEAVIQQLQQAVQSGQITDEQAMQEAQNMGIM